MDFMVFEMPTVILSLKISQLATYVAMHIYRGQSIHEIFILKLCLNQVCAWFHKTNSVWIIYMRVYVYVCVGICVHMCVSAP